MFSPTLNPRRPPEEKGSFGKTRTRRYGSTRSRSKTLTPARTNDPNKQYEDMIFDQFRKEYQEREEATSRNQTQFSDSAKPVAEKTPTECILYGYKEDMQWKAIWKYEKISLGMICEDYPRTSPFDSPRFHSALAQRSVAPPRPLTKAEAKKAMKAACGAHWIKVTFEDSESADRACGFSPQPIDGQTVFCELYRGAGPDKDEAIPWDSEGAKRPRPATISKAQSTPSLPQGTEIKASTLPRSFNLSSFSQQRDRITPDQQSETSTTASSATAIATPPSTDVRQRSNAQHDEYMTHIRSVRRTKLKPISECLPPQPSVTEKVIRTIPIVSHISSDGLIGLGLVKKENGDLDWENTSLYWRIMWFIDAICGTDICGLKADKEEAEVESAR